MASLMEELMVCFESEITLYQDLVKAASEKTDIIVKGDIKQLEEYTSLEQDITSQIKNVDNRRLQKIREMASVINRDEKDLTITNLISYLQNRSEEQERLTNIQSRLKSVLEEMKQVNEQNAVLLQQAMELVEFDLMLFKSMRQAPETANYDKRAYNTGTLLGSGGFDAKQ